jgi:hypothetical protein
MSINTRFINKRTMKQVNAALVEAGYSEWVGDKTTTHPEGQGSGYVNNLLHYMEPTDAAARQRLESIVTKAIA